MYVLVITGVTWIKGAKYQNICRRLVTHTCTYWHG